MIRMTSRELLQLRSIRRVAGLDLARLRESELFEENALELEIGVDVEILSGKVLDSALLGRHFFAEFER